MFARATPTTPSSITRAGMSRSTKDWSKKSSPKPQEYGLTSKGDTRLTDYKHQESFFRDIKHRYLTHCGSFPSVPALDEQFNLLSIKANSVASPSASPSKHNNNTNYNNNVTTTTTGINASPQITDISTLQNILMDMRKLREGLLSSNRLDAFSKSAYIFITRSSILMSHPESYFPSIRHLLYIVHPQLPLSNPEVNELASYLMLHLACSTNSYHDAYEVKHRFGVKDVRVDMVIKALVRGDYVLFWKMKRVVDGYKARIMEIAGRDVRKHALKCIGAAYHSLPVSVFEGMIGTMGGWVALKEEFALGWEVDEEGKIVIKRRSNISSGNMEGKGKVLSVIKEPPTVVVAAEGNKGQHQSKVKSEKSTIDTGEGLGASRWSTANQDANLQKKGSDNWTKWG